MLKIIRNLDILSIFSLSQIHLLTKRKLLLKKILLLSHGRKTNFNLVTCFVCITVTSLIVKSKSFFSSITNASIADFKNDWNTRNYMLNIKCYLLYLLLCWYIWNLWNIFKKCCNNSCFLEKMSYWLLTYIVSRPHLHV